MVTALVINSVVGTRGYSVIYMTVGQALRDLTPYLASMLIEDS